MTQRRAYTWNQLPTWLVIATVAVLALVAQPALAKQRSCSLTTLRGLYSVSSAGYFITSAGSAPNAAILFLTFNGDGTFTSLATVNFNGTLVAENKRAGGHYTVNPDCTGSFGADPGTPGPHFEILVSPDGTTFNLITSDPGSVAAAEAKRLNQNPAE